MIVAGFEFDEHDLVAVLEQHLARLDAGVVELRRLADDDRPRADQHDLLDVVAPRHGPPPARSARAPGAAHLGPVVVGDRVVGGVDGPRPRASACACGRSPRRLAAAPSSAAARALVAGVGLELDPHAAEVVEGMAEHQQLRFEVGAGAPGRRVEPGPADLEAVVLRAHGRDRRSCRSARRCREIVAKHHSSPCSGPASRVVEPAVEGESASLGCGDPSRSRSRHRRRPRRAASR